MSKRQITLFFFIIATVLIGGFAWLEFKRPADNDPRIKIVPHLDVGKLPQLGDSAQGFVIKTKKSKDKTEDTATPQPETSAEELLEKLREQRTTGDVEIVVTQPATDDMSGNMNDGMSDEQFQELLRQVRNGKGRWFSKRFEVDTITALRRRGYNPDGSLIEPTPKTDSDAP